MTTLILGAKGQVGYELLRQIDSSDVVAVARNVADDSEILCFCDLSEPAEVASLLKNSSPHLILSAAAYTAVDQAEDDIDQARALNHRLPKQLAEYASEAGAALVHYSTDYIFAGDFVRPYRETDPPGPIGIYGKTKLAGEQAIMASGCQYLIFRTSWVYANRGKNFLLTMLRLAREHDVLTIVDDQVGTPTNAANLAELTLHALQSLQEKPWPEAPIFNLSSHGEVSWFGFADYFLDRALVLGLIDRKPALEAVNSEQFQTRACRPKWSVLDNSYYGDYFQTEVPHWRSQVDRCLTSLAERQKAINSK